MDDPRTCFSILKSALEHIRQALLDILHQYRPQDPQELYRFFKNNRSKIEMLIKQHKLKWNHLNKLMPSNEKTDSSIFGTNLICVVINEFTSLSLPTDLKDDDYSVEASIIRARNLKNRIEISTIRITDNIFNQTVDEIRYILRGLKYRNIQVFDNLLTVIVN